MEKLDRYRYFSERLNRYADFFYYTGDGYIPGLSRDVDDNEIEIDIIASLQERRLGESIFDFIYEFLGTCHSQLALNDFLNFHYHRFNGKKINFVKFIGSSIEDLKERVAKDKERYETEMGKVMQDKVKNIDFDTYEPRISKAVQDRIKNIDFDTYDIHVDISNLQNSIILNDGNSIDFDTMCLISFIVSQINEVHNSSDDLCFLHQLVTTVPEMYPHIEEWVKDKESDLFPELALQKTKKDKKLLSLPQQILLLYHLGFIDLLQQEYNLSKEKIAKIVSMVTNGNEDNTGDYIRYLNQKKEKTAPSKRNLNPNTKENLDFIKQILNELGLAISK